MPEANSPPLDPKEEVQLSKLLSYLLRHGAVKEKLNISSDGFVAVNNILSRPKFKHVTFEQIQYLVAHNDKKRYELVQTPEGEWLVRASQGHSLKAIKPDDMMEEITGPLDTPVIHGTTLQAWGLIKQQGLSKMGRNHIHFAVGLPNDPNVKSGIRKSSQVFIYIDVEKARQDGIVFYRSKNNVILSEGIQGIIAPGYFNQVTDRDNHRLLEL
ncbi:RNA 2'-phosphotransferase, Tpt1 / KptA family protein [Mucor ambiguus]|uniref:2'-phosphotransferase n=1 Tax=Mucor ambiguus TaxID=91626 RepID=A0A0C9M2N1_9FUNG|nr:RNA 2'-phosphotransferase, Tpt1 / KptA family protein [Mucor ambiguus]